MKETPRPTCSLRWSEDHRLEPKPPADRAPRTPPIPQGRRSPPRWCWASSRRCGGTVPRGLSFEGAVGSVMQRPASPVTKYQRWREFGIYRGESRRGGLGSRNGGLETLKLHAPPVLPPCDTQNPLLRLMFMGRPSAMASSAFARFSAHQASWSYSSSSVPAM